MPVETLPVLVVGAGPSGLMCAHELRRFGIAVVVIEKEIEKSPFSRAIAVQIRTLEIFHALKMLEHLREKSNDVVSIELFAESRPAITIPIQSTSSFFEQLLVVDQPHTEHVLQTALAQREQEIMRGVELVDFVGEASGIRANLRMPHGEIKTERFSYIVGADGAHSFVRKKMTNQFLGSTYDDAFILADATCEHPFDDHTFRIFFCKLRFLALIPMHGKNHYRLISVRRGERRKMGQPPTIEEFQDLAKAVVPFALEIKNPVWVSRFFVQCRSATNYQEERIFLVGDAAHIHSPAGGQGMNTGLQDAFNLAWKLALTIKGFAKPDLLATYHDERKPVGDFLIDRTDRLFKFMVKSSLWARLLRRFVLPLVSRSSRFRSRLLTIGSQTAIRYERGAICAEIKHSGHGALRIGKRIGNVKLMRNAQATDLHTETSRGFFSCWLFLPKNVANETARRSLQAVGEMSLPFSKILSVHVVYAHSGDTKMQKDEAEHFVAISPSAEFQVAEPFYVIIRPDHHVFCYGSIKELNHVAAALARFVQVP